MRLVQNHAAGAHRDPNPQSRLLGRRVGRRYRVCFAHNAGLRRHRRLSARNPFLLRSNPDPPKSGGIDVREHGHVNGRAFRQRFLLENRLRVHHTPGIL
jgi:hypothetical protein